VGSVAALVECGCNAAVRDSRNIGMEDAITATFAVIDWKKQKLTIAPSATTPRSGSAETSWSFSEDQSSAVFAFLKKNVANKVYVAISYSMKV
jgi:hypothetical protein